MGKKKNLKVDEMGDLRGWIRIAKHDLGKPQTPKMRGLKVFPNKHGDTDERGRGGIAAEETKGDRP